MKDSEKVIEVLGKMGIKPSETMIRGIIMTYHSCGIEDASITLEDTAKSIGYDILEKHNSKR